MMWILLTIATLAADAPRFQAQTLDGQLFEGPIVALDAQNIGLESAAGRARLPLATVTTVLRYPTAPDQRRQATLWVELVDQSGLAATEYTAHDGLATIKTVAGTSLSVPTQAIRFVRFAPPAAPDAKLAKQWADILEIKDVGDILVVRKQSALDYLEGVLGDVTADVCRFEVDGETVPVKRAKVEGILYFHPPANDVPEAIGQLIATDGSRVSLVGASLADGAVHVTTPAGVALTVPLESVARLDFSVGKIAYLSDLQPESAEYVPYLGFKEEPASVRQFYQFRRDVGFEQNPLRLDGKTYRKGLSLQSRTVLSYKLPGRFRQFQATIGIDDSVRDSGNVHLEIKGDGKILWQGEVRGTEPASKLELEIAGVKRLEIVADFGGELDIGDRLDLCDARVVK